MMNGRFKKILMSAACAMVIAAGTAFAQTASKIEMKYAVVYPPVGAQAEGAAELAKLISEASGGIRALSLATSWDSSKGCAQGR